MTHLGDSQDPFRQSLAHSCLLLQGMKMSPARLRPVNGVVIRLYPRENTSGPENRPVNKSQVIYSAKNS